MGMASPLRPHQRGFTLVELLLVIVLIVLLISLVVPGLHMAWELARSLKEQSLVKQQMVGYATYTTTYKDRTLPGSPHWNWAHSTNQYCMHPPDPLSPGSDLTGSITKIWTMHFAGLMNYDLTALQFDKATLADFLTRPQASGPGEHDAGADTAQGALAYHPSFGYNGVYIGGSYNFGAFRHTGDDGGPSGNPRAAGGNFYVTNVSKVQHPEKLIVFAGSRGGDVQNAQTYFWNYGADRPDIGPVLPGYYVVTPPRPHPCRRGSGNYDLHWPDGMNSGWIASNKWDPGALPSAWGMLNARYLKKVATVMFDGHARSQTLEELRDMRKWSNFANRADWDFVPAP